jgi:hypothetical protein
MVDSSDCIAAYILLCIAFTVIVYLIFILTIVVSIFVTINNYVFIVCTILLLALAVGWFIAGLAWLVCSYREHRERLLQRVYHSYSSFTLWIPNAGGGPPTSIKQFIVFDNEYNYIPDGGECPVDYDEIYEA